MKTATLVFGLALAVAASQIQAQENGRGPREGGAGRGAGEGGRRGGENGGPGAGGERMRFKPPLFSALDANGDGAIDAGEIAKAAESLKSLDKNRDGKITAEECMPPRPTGEGEGRQGGVGPGGGEGRRGGPQQGKGGGEGGRRGGPQAGGGEDRPLRPEAEK